MERQNEKFLETRQALNATMESISEATRRVVERNDELLEQFEECVLPGYELWVDRDDEPSVHYVFSPETFYAFLIQNADEIEPYILKLAIKYNIQMLEEVPKELLLKNQCLAVKQQMTEDLKGMLDLLERTGSVQNMLTAKELEWKREMETEMHDHEW